MPTSKKKSTSSKTTTSTKNGSDGEVFVPCFIRSLPDKDIPMAAQYALEQNPANGTPLSVRTTIATIGNDVVTPSMLTSLIAKRWPAEGVRLTVSFLSNASSVLKERILSYMNKWRDYANVEFTLATGNTYGDVRISLGPGGYWSYLGTDIRFVGKSQPTMNLEAFSLSTPESEYSRVVTHETGHCLHGDTLIDCPRDLEKYPQGIPIKDLVGKTPWVYAWKNGRLTVAKASCVWLSKVNVPVVRVKIKPGKGHHAKHFLPSQEIVGTPDHPVLLADGQTWRNLGDLQPGDRLCSMYRSKNGKRSRIRWTGCTERVREHVFVCEKVHGNRPYKHDAHHINERMLDQSPENLQWKSEFSHHSDHSKGKTLTKEHIAKLIAANKSRIYTDEKRAELSRIHRERVREPMSDEDRAKVSEQFKGKKQFPELVEKRRQAMLRFYANGGRSGMFGKKASEETKAKHRAVQKRLKQHREEVNNHTVVSVENAGFQDVYDISVPGANSFVANGVIVHNSLGMPHEHARQEIIDRLDYEAVIRYFMSTQGWSRQDVIYQILTPLEESKIEGSLHADDESVMTYSFPASLTKDKKAIRGGKGITASDGAQAAKFWPKSIEPTKPPPEMPDPLIVKVYRSGKIEIDGYSVVRKVNGQ